MGGNESRVPATDRVPHLRDGLIVAKVGHRAKRDQLCLRARLQQCHIDRPRSVYRSAPSNAEGLGVKAQPKRPIYCDPLITSKINELEQSVHKKPSKNPCQVPKQLNSNKTNEIEVTEQFSQFAKIELVSKRRRPRTTRGLLLLPHNPFVLNILTIKPFRSNILHV